MFSVPHMVFGENILSDVRLCSTPGGGVQILRYAF
jgi:hypothetical protein